jgi:hypothetical protein
MDRAGSTALVEWLMSFGVAAGSASSLALGGVDDRDNCVTM